MIGAQVEDISLWYASKEMRRRQEMRVHTSTCRSELGDGHDKIIGDCGVMTQNHGREGTRMRVHTPRAACRSEFGDAYKPLQLDKSIRARDRCEWLGTDL
jgi:hypothetical protein